MSQDGDTEIILAQEQGVLCKRSAIGLSSDVQGTLILTNQRLVFASDGRTTQVSTRDEFGAFAPLSYTEVEDLGKIQTNERNVFVPLSSITDVSGHKGIVGRPNLKVTWKESNESTNSTEFTQTLTGRERKKNLNDWASVIQRLKSGALIPRPNANLPDKNSLEGRILYVLGDMQTKGLLQIEEETEKQFETELESDDVERASEQLVSLGLVDKVPDPSGEEFYKKKSPLGEDDLSS